MSAITPSARYRAVRQKPVSDLCRWSEAMEAIYVSSRHYDRHDYRSEKLAACRTWEDYVARISTG